MASSKEIIELQQLFNKYPAVKYALTIHRSTRGRPLSFSQRSWLLDLYTLEVKKNSQEVEETVYCKSVQLGISELLILETLRLAGDEGLSTLYILPTEVLRSRVVANRIEPCIARSKTYRDMLLRGVGRVDSVGLKRLNNASVAFVGSNSKAAFTEIPVDRIVIDELDLCDPDNLELAYDRYSAAPRKILVTASNPTGENVGIGIKYSKSCKKRWHVPCEHCGNKQILDWFRDVVVQESEGVYKLRDTSWTEDCGRDVGMPCRRCGGLLDRFARGEWVAEEPTNPVQGFQISKLFGSPTTLISAMWAKYKEAIANEGKLQVFMNSDLGLPYTTAESKMTTDLLKRCTETEPYYCPPYIPLSHPGTVLGADVGKVIHVIIDEVHVSGVRRAIYIGRVSNFEQLGELFTRFNCVLGVVDARPETREAIRFQSQHPGVVYLCDYYSTEGTNEVKVDEKTGMLHVDRTQTLDTGMADILSRRRRLPKDALTLDGGDFGKQMCAPTREYISAKNVFRWVSGDKADHYRHADNYALIAFMIRDRARRGLQENYDPKGYLEDGKNMGNEDVRAWLFPEYFPKSQCEPKAGADKVDTNRFQTGSRGLGLPLSHENKS